MSRTLLAVIVAGAGAGAYWLHKASTSIPATAGATFGAAGDQAIPYDGSMGGGDYASLGLDGPAPADSHAAPDEGVVDAGGVSDGFLNVAYRVGSFFSGGAMHTSINGQDLIKNHEALRLTTYLDVAGKPTIGYGHLLTGGESYPNGISEEKAGALLVADLATAENAVNGAIKVAITQNMFDACVSLAFNIGAGAFKNSTVVRRLNAGDVTGAAAAFGLWNKVSQGGQLVVSAGLANRRADEANHFLEGATV